MKVLLSLLMHHLKRRPSRRNLLILMQFFAFMLVMIATYSVIFHFLMEREGHDYSWVTGVYWTLTVMSTLGFGDITFHTDLGRIFSIIVLISGVTSLLVFMPFTFIEFFYEPWIRAQSDKRVPRSLQISGHVVLAGFGSITNALIAKLVHFNYKYVLLISKLDDALRLYDQGYNVVVGDLDDPETFRRINVEQAVLVAVAKSDFVNTTFVSTVREVSSKVPVISTARARETTDILKFAGCTHVLELSEMVGQALARRTRGDEATAHVIGRMDKVLIAEANAVDTPFVGKTLKESRIRNTAGVTVVGLWQRGRFEIAHHEIFVDPKSVLVIACSSDQLSRFNEICKRPKVSTMPVIIIGGGRVGLAAAEGLALRGIEYRVVEQNHERILDEETYIHGDALKPQTLVQAGIKEAQTVIISTHDDDINIYLTIYCRRMRGDIQIISRVRKERNVPTLQRVGSDFVISDAAMGANTIFNMLKRSNILMVAEGLDVFKVEVPKGMVGKTIIESAVRNETGCSIVAVENKGETIINPPPDIKFETGMQIVLIGTLENENRFLEKFGTVNQLQ